MAIDAPTFEQLKAVILQAYPALDESFYADGDMDVLRDDDKRNYSSNPQSKRRLENLPERFRDQLGKLPVATDFVKTSLAQRVSEIEHGTHDSMHTTVHIAAHNVELRGKKAQEDWGNYVKPKQVLQSAFARLFRNADEVKNVLGIHKGEIEVPTASNGMAADRLAADLVNAYFEGNGIVVPEQHNPRPRRS